MCTVSFVSGNGQKIITSNRDENVQRKTAAAPAFELVNNKKIIFPKDAKAGGTWFAASDDGTVAVLLNGAFVKHIPKPPYRKSRGLVLLDIIASADPLSYFNELNLQHIEPFTVVVYQPGYLHELRWDSEQAYKKELDISGNYIWSSATLYSDEVISHRKNLFDKFIKNNVSPTAEQVHRFHADNNQDDENGFVINRQTGMRTFSITQVIEQEGRVEFFHSDLLQHQQYKETIQLAAG